MGKKFIFLRNDSSFEKIVGPCKFYRIDSWLFYKTYRRYINNMSLRLSLLFDQLHEVNQEIITSNFRRINIPDANGLKTILDMHYILEDQILHTPLTVNWNIYTGKFGIEPGNKRASMIPYLKRQQIEIAVFNSQENFINEEFEIDPKTLTNRENLLYQKMPYTEEGTFYNTITNYNWPYELLRRCKKDNIIVRHDFKNIWVNEKLLCYTKDNEYYLNVEGNIEI